MKSSRVPGFDNLNSEVLRETVEDLRALGFEERSIFEHALAQTIIINSLGGDFWAKECTSFGDKQTFFDQKPDVRVVHLAHMLWCLKNSKGFRDFMAKNDRNRFETTYYECNAAHWFFKMSSAIEFVVPKGMRGSDFDIFVSDFRMGGDLNVEVKARTVAFSSRKQVKNFLSSHRNQLPANESGVIFCKLESTGAGIEQEVLIEEARKFVQGTSRIDFVVFCWDASLQANAIVLEYIAVGSEGKMKPIFLAPTGMIISEFMKDSGLCSPLDGEG